MPSALEMITTALVDVSAFGPGDTIPAADSTYALDKMMSMLDSWNIDPLMIYQVLQESKALTSSVGSYAIGVGGAFNTTRPTKIVDPSFIRDADDADSPLTIIDAAQYGRLISKTTDGTIPEYLFYDGADVAGLGTIKLYPEPSAGLTLYINSWKQLQSFSALTDELVMPPGYQLAIESNLSLLLGPSYGKQLSDDLKRTARDSKAAIKRFNAPAGVLRMPAGLPSIRQRSNILTGP